MYDEKSGKKLGMEDQQNVPPASPTEAPESSGMEKLAIRQWNRPGCRRRSVGWWPVYGDIHYRIPSLFSKHERAYYDATTPFGKPGWSGVRLPATMKWCIPRMEQRSVCLGCGVPIRPLDDNIDRGIFLRGLVMDLC
jgi:hypothetical protein